jgi:hypothetical protein
MATITAVPKTRIAGGGFLLEERRPEVVFTPEDFSEQHRLIGQTVEELTLRYAHLDGFAQFALLLMWRFSFR